MIKGSGDFMGRKTCVSYYPAKLDYGSRDIVCHKILQDHVIKVPFDFIARSPR